MLAFWWTRAHGRARALRPLPRLAVAAGGLFVVLYVATVCTLPGQTIDYRLWELTLRLPAQFQSDLDDFSRAVMPVLSVLILVLDSVLRRVWTTILIGVVALVAASAAAYALRTTLPRPDFNGAAGIPVNTFPSTHVAIVAAPLAAIIVAIGPRTVAAGVYALLILLAMVGNTTHFVHRPVDTVGAVLLSISVVAVVTALVQPRQQRR